MNNALEFVDTAPKPKKEFNPSPYQLGVSNWVRDNIRTGKHLIVQACAGSGKTTTGVWLFGQLPDDVDVVYVAFNRHIADELNERLPQGSNAQTYHSLGLKTLRHNVSSLRIDTDKIENYLRRMQPASKWIIPSTKRLVSLFKSGIKVVPSIGDLEMLAFEHDIDLYEQDGNTIARDMIFEMTARALAYSRDTPDRPDFDDMIWLPNVLDGLTHVKHDFILGDEFQDTNSGQAALIVSSIVNTGNIVGVGDRWQSIYRFRGADSNAMDNLKRTLDADELPLSLSYRCPVEVGELVNREFPHIRFELPTWAKPGKVYNTTEKDVSKNIRPDDMVLCRVNADLVSMAFALIRDGIKATVRGRDIGKGLQALIRKSKKDNVPDLLDWLSAWKTSEIEKAYRIGADSKIQNIDDKVQTIYALTDGTDSVADVLARCDTMFSDDKNGVVLSTIHKAKGLEAERVFILRPDLLPHPAAKKAEDLQQENNIRYVAFTRALDELAFVY